MPDIICLGEALIDFVALESGVSLMEASGFHKAPGGAPANVAVGLVRLGVSSAFLGKVGEDPFGHFLEHTLSQAGVDTTGMVFDTQARTGLAFVSLTQHGERDFVFYRNPSADMRYTLAELNRKAFDSARIFHYGSITLISEPSRSATLAARQLAKEHHLLLSCDPNLRLNLWDSEQNAREGLFLAMQDADIIKVSAEELQFLFGDNDPEKGALQLIERGADLVFVTLGDQGAYYRTNRFGAYVPPFYVQVIDTTGAGDGFMAGVLSQILASSNQSLKQLSSEELHNITRYGNAVGALTTTRKGAIPSLPTQLEINHFLASMQE